MDERLLDPINRRILGELQNDGRLSVAELARRLHLSPPAVAERLSKLESAGVIRGYHADVDPAAAGYSLSVIIRMRPAPHQLHKVAQLVRGMDEVVECHRITGEDCYLIKAHVRDVSHLEELVDQLVPHGQTTTSIVQSSPVPPRGVALSGLVGEDLVDGRPTRLKGLPAGT
ncbi:MAG TPA: Lrp/AsnC family transcriptional regulator [Solirubrobacteraceae bacterium]|nr:Lrp/AsnC family transcriptional regulator [Solirubrobacteraceae bacterium]